MKIFPVSIFTKIIILIVMILGAVITLYVYSNRVSIQVVEEEIRSSSLDKLSFFAYQIETNIQQLAENGLVLTRDPSMLAYQRSELLNEPYDRLLVIGNIVDKLNVYSVTKSWDNAITVYFPRTGEQISTQGIIQSYNHETVPFLPSQSWTYREGAFIWHMFDPIDTINQPARARLIMEISFGAQNLTSMMDAYKTGSNGDPFIWSPDQSQPPIIANSSASLDKIGQLIEQLPSYAMPDQGTLTVKLDGIDYLVGAVRSDSLGWYYMDYVPLQQTLSPILFSRNLFYVTTAMILAAGILAAYLLYRNVQVPIRILLRGTHRLRAGNFSARIEETAGNEFDYLFNRFNAMAEQIQQLIETVYEEKIRSREATLKHLQSQINPHFLYNCLFYIKNMARIGDTDSVQAMSLSLGEYYRSITRDYRQNVALRDEIELVRNYLVIQNLRSERFIFTIEMPEEMLELTIPRLTLQPVVENAILHGLEPKPGIGTVSIHGSIDGEWYRIAVEDNGVGMTEERLEQLTRQLSSPMQEDIGCGTWNVHQRLLYQFGEGSGLLLEQVAGGGLKVTLQWRNIPA